VNLRASRVVLRQRTLSDVLDLALPFCLAGRRPLGAVAVVALGGVAALAGVARRWGHWGWPAVWLLIIEAAALLEGAFTVVLGDLLFREPREISPRASLLRFLRRLPAFVVAIAGRQILLAASFVLLFVPFLQGPATQFVPEALLLENATPGRAWTRSRILARNRGGFTFGLWLATLALPALGAVMGDQLCNAVVSMGLQLGKPTGDLFSEGGSGFAVLGALLAVPVAASARFLGYVDLRTRKEGWDIQLRFMGIVAETSTGRRSAA
jgi:hypothetical protein